MKASRSPVLMPYSLETVRADGEMQGLGCNIGALVITYTILGVPDYSKAKTFFPEAVLLMLQLMYGLCGFNPKFYPRTTLALSNPRMPSKTPTIWGLVAY